MTRASRFPLGAKMSVGAPPKYSGAQWSKPPGHAGAHSTLPRIPESTGGARLGAGRGPAVHPTANTTSTAAADNLCLPTDPLSYDHSDCPSSCVMRATLSTPVFAYDNRESGLSVTAYDHGKVAVDRVVIGVDEGGTLEALLSSVGVINEGEPIVRRRGKGDGEIAVGVGEPVGLDDLGTLASHVHEDECIPKRALPFAA